MKESINYADFILGPSTHDKCACSMISYNDKVMMTFGKTTKSNFLPEYIFTKLVELGVNVEVKSNY